MCTYTRKGLPNPAVVCHSCRMSTQPDLTALYDAALPDDEPGAWIRAAIKAVSEDAAEATS
jgi:hypothetical protein